MTRFLLSLTILVFPFLSAAEDTSKPNIVLIVADDLGWSGLGCFGSKFYETPNLDRLAAEGVKFTSGYAAAANCAPSRASIMSGQYTPRHGVLYVGPGTYQIRHQEKHGNLKRFKMIQPPGKTELAPEVETIAGALQRDGYRTAMFGKWHLGRNENHPSQRGFEVAIESHGAHFDYKTDPEVEGEKPEYLTDFLSDRGAEFIRESSEKGNPFFLYYADFLIHKPLEAKEALLSYFGEKEPSENQRSPMAAAMIKSLDDSVGKLLDALDEAGVANNTLILFTSDNGGLAYEEDGLREENTSNLPLRGRKGAEYEGGIRVPWIVRWPGKAPENVTSGNVVHHVDIYPTLLEVAGVEPPTDQPLDGISLVPIFMSPEVEAKKRTVFWYLPGYSAFHEPSVIARRGSWKMIRSLEDESYQLYNTDQDIAETKDRALNNSRIGETLSNEAMAWLDEINAPRMTPNPEYEAPDAE